MGEIGTAGAEPGVRMEHDLLGELAVPNDAYGGHTARALRDFTRLPAELLATITGGTA